LRARVLVDGFGKLYFKDAEKTQHNQLWKSIFGIAKREIILAIILRIFSDIMMVSVPFLIRRYAKLLREWVNGLVEFSYMNVLNLLFVIIAVLLQDFAREHSGKKINIGGTKIGQSLRSILFEKLIDADYDFLNRADPSYLSRIILFEIDNLLEFVSALPALLSTPFAISISATLIIIELEGIKYSYLIPTLIIILTTILFFLYKLTMRVTKGRINYSRIQSKSAIKIQEMISGINHVNLSSFQDIFVRTLVDLRA
jgi:ABC-type transport system involved in cytochrome bd biosynthesis fused ATPase/permease subunit